MCVELANTYRLPFGICEPGMHAVGYILLIRYYGLRLLKKINASTVTSFGSEKYTLGCSTLCQSYLMILDALHTRKAIYADM